MDENYKIQYTEVIVIETKTRIVRIGLIPIHQYHFDEVLVLMVGNILTLAHHIYEIRFQVLLLQFSFKSLSLLTQPVRILIHLGMNLLNLHILPL